MIANRLFELIESNAEPWTGLDNNRMPYTAVAVDLEGIMHSEHPSDQETFTILLPVNSAVFLANSILVAATQAAAIATGRNN